MKVFVIWQSNGVKLRINLTCDHAAQGEVESTPSEAAGGGVDFLDGRVGMVAKVWSSYSLMSGKCWYGRCRSLANRLDDGVICRGHAERPRGLM